MTSIYKSLSKFIKAFSNDTRLMILKLLKEKDHSLNSLRESINISQPALSKQLKILLDASISEQNRQDNKYYYTIVSDDIFKILNEIKSLYIDLQEKNYEKIGDIKSENVFSN